MRVWGYEDMDPRDRADAVLARAGARKGVVTPDNMTSPMDSASTLKIPRAVVQRIDAEPDPDTTTKLPASMIRANDTERRESHLAEADQTTSLREATDQATVTQPLRIQPEGADGPNAASAGAEQEEPGTEEGGLVPTVTKQQQPQSYVARRLEGL
ncbi:hypothetical protein SAMN02982918_3852 [Saccharomonospora viridis]|nr:hypothetical protein SAMN02982918_3852 [Saccharomonospora viridis]